MGIFLSHVCWGAAGPPLTTPVGPSGVLVTAGQKGGGGGWEMDISDPPWAQANFPPPKPWEGEGLTQRAFETFDNRVRAVTSRQRSVLAWFALRERHGKVHRDCSATEKC